MNNEKKMQYEEPKLCIVVLQTADIITSSGFEGLHDSLYPNDEQQNYFID